MPPASRAVTIAAFAVPLCVLPSAAWRIGHVVDALLHGIRCEGGAGELLYVAGLSVVSMAAALATVGLVRPWGQAVPRWVPVAGGRALSPRAVIAVAASGATVIALITGYGVLNGIFGFAEGPRGPARPGCEPQGTAVAVAYAPLVAWAPLLVVVTRDYARRARGHGPDRHRA